MDKQIERMVSCAVDARDNGMEKEQIVDAAKRVFGNGITLRELEELARDDPGLDVEFHGNGRMKVGRASGF